MEPESKRILIVEDEDAIRALLFTVLRRRQLSVDTARNGLEALERCRRCRYAVVLLDLMMPVMNGYEFLDQVAAMPAEDRPVVIVLSAGGPFAQNLNPEFVAGSLRKPFDIELLVDTVGACLQTAAERGQREGCPQADSDSETVRLRRSGETN